MRLQHSWAANGHASVRSHLSTCMCHDCSKCAQQLSTGMHAKSAHCGLMPCRVVNSAGNHNPRPAFAAAGQRQLPQCHAVRGAQHLPQLPGPRAGHAGERPDPLLTNAQHLRGAHRARIGRCELLVTRNADTGQSKQGRWSPLGLHAAQAACQAARASPRSGFIEYPEHCVNRASVAVAPTISASVACSASVSAALSGRNHHIGMEQREKTTLFLPACLQTA